jgi:hypothetical protein
LLQDQHFPLSRMVMRSDVAVGLKRNQKPLDWISRSIVQQLVSPFARHCRSLSRQLFNLETINDLNGTRP